MEEFVRCLTIQSMTGAKARVLAWLDEVDVLGEIGVLDGEFYGRDGNGWVSLMPSWSDLTA